MANGRYGKIKVWAPGNYWAQPTRMHVYDGTNWVDFGLNDSSNTNMLSTWDPNSESYKNILQTKTSVHDYWYIDGQFTLPLPTTGTYSGTQMGHYCWNPNTNSNAKRNWVHIIRCTMMRTSNTDQNIFTNINSGASTFNGSSNGTQVLWLANGKIQLTTKYTPDGGSTSKKTVTSTNAVTALNTWVDLEIKVQPSSSASGSTVTITFNNVITTTNNLPKYLGINKRNFCGDANIKFKNTYYIKMSCYRNSAETASECTIDIENKTVTPNPSGYTEPTYVEEYKEVWS